MFIALLAAVFGVAMVLQTYVYLSDCSADGVRASKWIDDMDRSSACLPPMARTAGLFAVPLIWTGISLAAVIAYRKRLFRLSASV
ncbi:MAG: hypothetical protein AAGL11_04105 [Pseudomonadota bacterium]